MNQTANKTTANRLILMTRYPKSGQTKTRLIPALGPGGAACLHRQLIQKTWQTANQFSRNSNCQTEICYAGGDAEQMQELLGTAAICLPQQGDSLGERMHLAVTNAISQGAENVVVIGTDCLDINPVILENAFAGLKKNDIVLGPAIDGGYYLIGLRQPCLSLFEGINWGTDTVFNQTINQCKDARLSVHQLQPLSDIDYPEDLIICRRHGLKFSNTMETDCPGLISTVIPTLNEESYLERTLSPLMKNKAIEIIIADGGSNDQTVGIANRLGVRVVQSQSGRGRQMNAGAAVASGELLLFLHADSLLPDDFEKQIHSTLKPDCIAGAFRLRIDGNSTGLRWVERGANWRSRWRQMPYGDQGLFLQTEKFFELGGFKNWSLMEDYEFCRRLRKAGTIKIVPADMITSGRRWKHFGILRTTLSNQLCIAAYHLGVSPETLARFYKRG